MKPILFNIEMVKAILDGRKTQTRRLIPYKISLDGRYEGWRDKDIELKNGRIEIFTTLWRTIKAKYKVDDILYVRETFQTCECGFCEICQVLDGIVFKADYNNKGEHPDLYSCHEDETYWKPSIHLKQKDARLFLKVTNVRVERLQDIGFLEVQKEGFITYWSKSDKEPSEYSTTRKEKRVNGWYIHHLDKYIKNWNSTAKDGYKWEDNPYVFVYEFEIVKLGEVK